MIDGTQFGVSDASRKKAEGKPDPASHQGLAGAGEEAANGFGFDRWRVGKVAIGPANPSARSR